MTNEYYKEGKKLKLTVATRKDIIDEVKESESKCIVKNGKLYVCYNTLFSAQSIGVKVVKNEVD